MYGIEAITHHNGWAMAIAGVIIVFAGLVILSSTIAQFHKILMFWEDRDAFYTRFNNRRPASPPADAAVCDLKMYQNLSEAVQQFKLITDRIGEPFSLSKLLKLAELSGLPYPHSTVNTFIKTGMIVPDGKGYYGWKQN